eukprot:351133-Chlamydomonas_euryale.AAC.3
MSALAPAHSLAASSASSASLLAASSASLCAAASFRGGSGGASGCAACCDSFPSAATSGAAGGSTVSACDSAFSRLQYDAALGLTSAPPTTQAQKGHIGLSSSVPHTRKKGGWSRLLAHKRKGVEACQHGHALL